jgi:hypothetical protein
VTDANNCTSSTTHTVLFLLVDTDGDGVCDDEDLCPGGPDPGMSCDDGNAATMNDTVQSDCSCVGQAFVLVDVKALLDGPYDAGSGLMSDALRANGHLPLAHPYGTAPFNHVETATVSNTLLAVTGNNAIVDWVLVELRNALNPSQVVSRRAALLQRDGDVVDLDGTSPVLFLVNAGSYHVAIRHRNHFGVMTGAAASLTHTGTTIDFIDEATSTFGLDARRSVGAGAMALWSGNARVDAQLKYSGSQNDRDAILVKIGGLIPTAVVFGYHPEDVTMNGIVSYAGAGNDRDRILVNLNGSVISVRFEQLP